jgi:hypothetical protein
MFKAKTHVLEMRYQVDGYGPFGGWMPLAHLFFYRLGTPKFLLA